MVLGLIIYLSGQRWLPADSPSRPRPQGAHRPVIAGAFGIAALVSFGCWFPDSCSRTGWSERSALVVALYFSDAKSRPEDKFRVLALCILIP